MSVVSWLWAVGIFGVLWFVGTAIASDNDQEQYFERQLGFLASLITGPANWLASLVEMPAQLLKEYWAHQEKMASLQIETEADRRIGVLESIVISKGDA